MPYVISGGFSILSISKKCFSIPAPDSCVFSLMFVTFLSKFLLCYFKFLLFIPIFTSDFILIFSVLFVKKIVFNCYHTFALFLYYCNFVIKLFFRIMASGPCDTHSED